MIGLFEWNKEMKKKKLLFSSDEIFKKEQILLDCYKGENQKPIITLFRFYKGNYKDLIIAALVFLIRVSPSWILPLITASIIDIATERPQDAIHKFVVYGILTVAILLINIPSHTIFQTHCSRAQRTVEAGLRSAIIRKLQQLSITFHKDSASGKLQSKIMRDVETIENFASQIFLTALTVITNTTISLVIVINKNIIVFVMFLVCIPLSILLQRIFRSRMRKQSHDFRVQLENTASDVYDMEQLIPVTRAHALEEYELNKTRSSVIRVAESGYKMDKLHAVFGASSWVLFAFFQMVCLFFTGFLALRGEISIGDVSLYQSYFTALIGQISSLIGLLPIISRGAESINSIGEVLSSTNIEENENKFKLGSLKGDYEFKSINFEYDERLPVLNDFSLKVKSGETVALVGESGSGKTTVLNLAIGFNKVDSGALLIDGMDSSEIDMQSYRRFISVVPQNPILFSGSIRDNITYGCEDVSEEVLNGAIKAACLESVIEKLPLGLDTMVGERGVKLSGGQCQRVSIARAIIRNPSVIIFDEATSALDSITEKEIQEAIDNLSRERTTFIVAHRLSTVRNADKIAVMADGKCVEYGTYDELMALKGEFYKLKQMQL